MKLGSNGINSSSISSSNRNENRDDIRHQLRYFAGAYLAAICPPAEQITCYVLLTRYDALQTLGYQTMPSDDYADSSQEMEGPQQELVQTEGENRLLRHRLNTHRDQASGIEASLAEVAQLTELFTQQVMQQSEQIELLYHEVRKTTLLLYQHMLMPQDSAIAMYKGSYVPSICLMFLNLKHPYCDLLTLSATPVLPDLK